MNNTLVEERTPMSTLTAIQKTLEAQTRAVKIEPNSADTSLVESRESDVLIQGSNATVKNAPIAGGVSLIGGEPNRESIAGGVITLQGGHQTLSQSTSQAGGVNIFSGDGYLGGDVWIVGGDNLDNSASSLTGSITIQTGGQDATSSNNTGSILVNTGNATATAQSGALTLKSGTVDNNTPSTNLTSGNVVISSGAGLNNGAGWSSSGDLNLETGESQTRASGDMTIKSGDTHSATSSGSVSINSGSNDSSGYSGNVILGAGSVDFSTANTGTVFIKGGTHNNNLGGGVGLVRIQGGNKPNGATNANRPGSVWIEGGRQDNSFDFGGSKYGGNIELKAYGFGSVQADAYFIWLRTHDAGFTLDSDSWINLQSNDSSTDTSGYAKIITGESTVDDSGYIELKTGQSQVESGAHTSGDITLQTGIGDGANSGDISISTGNTVQDAFGVIKGVGSITLQTGDTSFASSSGGVEINTGDNTGAGTAGDINIQAGANTGTGSGGSAYLQAGATASGHGGFVYINGGDTVDPTFDFWGVQVLGSPVSFSTTDTYRSNVLLYGSQYTYDPSLTPSPNTLRGGDIEIKGGDVIQNGSLLSANDGSGSQDLGDVKVISGNVPTQANVDQRILTVQSDGVLKALGVQILGYGQIELTLESNNEAYRLPIFFANVTVNDGASDILLNDNNNYSKCVETYTGIDVWTATGGGVGFDYDTFITPSNLRVMTTYNTSDANASDIEAQESPIFNTEVLASNLQPYSLLRYSAGTNDEGAEGIRNTNNNAVVLRVQYVLIQTQ